MRLDLPPEFIQTIQDAFKEGGHKFLHDLPAWIDEASRRWNLKDIQPVSNLSYNFVAFAVRDQEDVVLKIGVPNPELASELAALRLFDGKGAVRLLESDEERGMLLMERVQPGDLLASFGDDERATYIAAEVMLNLWRPAPHEGTFIKLSDWFKGFQKLRTRFEGGTGPLDKKLVERAERSVAEFLSEEYAPTLIHGDLHHFNILSSGRNWLAIDPKGVIGPAAYEVGPLLINPWNKVTRISQHTDRRVAILSEQLRLERERVLGWGLAHAVLSAWWSLDDNMDWTFAMQCAEIFSKTMP